MVYWASWNKSLRFPIVFLRWRGEGNWAESSQDETGCVMMRRGVLCMILYHNFRKLFRSSGNLERKSFEEHWHISDFPINITWTSYTSTTQLLHLRLGGSCGRGAKKIVRARKQEGCCETQSPRKVREASQRKAHPTWLPNHDLTEKNTSRHAHAEGGRLMQPQL